MAKRLNLSYLLIGGGMITFIAIVAIAFYVSYQMGQKTNQRATSDLASQSRQEANPTLQIRRIAFIDQDTGEKTEIMMDGTVNQYDKSGKKIKSGRRGFAETQNLLRKFEYLINNNQTIQGGKYQIEIETQTGIITVGPGGTGDGPVDEAEDFIDHTVNPTPTPAPTPSPTGSSTPVPSAEPSPTPLPTDGPTPEPSPFTCADYYKAGLKPLRISNVYCGPDTTTQP